MIRSAVAAFILLTFFLVTCGTDDDRASSTDSKMENNGDDEGEKDDDSGGGRVVGNLAPGLKVCDGDLCLNGRRWMLKAVDTTYVWPEDTEAKSRMLENIADLGANTIRYGFYITHENIELAEQAGLYVLLMPLHLWYTYGSEEEMRDFVNEYEGHGNVIAWDVGNELYTSEFTIPVDLIEGYVRAVREEDDWQRLTFYGNHMALNMPDAASIPFLAQRGFGPVDRADVIGWNPYPLFLALSLDDMIGLFWYEIKPYLEQRNPLLAEIIDRLFVAYSEWADDMPQWMLDSPVGMGYLMQSYAWFANLHDWDPDSETWLPRPWVLTEWGFTRSPAGIDNVCAIIHEHLLDHSLDGFDFHSYPFFDWDLDGVIDPEAQEGYDRLKECFAGAVFSE